MDDTRGVTGVVARRKGRGDSRDRVVHAGTRDFDQGRAEPVHHHGRFGVVRGSGRFEAGRAKEGQGLMNLSQETRRVVSTSPYLVGWLVVCLVVLIVRVIVL